MGNNSSTSTSKSTSKSTEKKRNEQNELIRNAKRILNQRLQEYDYRYHGDYYTYVTYWQAEYELECIPKHCRSGNRGGIGW